MNLNLESSKPVTKKPTPEKLPQGAEKELRALQKQLDEANVELEKYTSELISLRKLKKLGKEVSGQIKALEQNVKETRGFIKKTERDITFFYKTNLLVPKLKQLTAQDRDRVSELAIGDKIYVKRGTQEIKKGEFPFIEWTLSSKRGNTYIFTDEDKKRQTRDEQGILLDGFMESSTKKGASEEVPKNTTEVEETLVGENPQLNEIAKQSRRQQLPVELRDFIDSFREDELLELSKKIENEKDPDMLNFLNGKKTILEKNDSLEVMEYWEKESAKEKQKGKRGNSERIKNLTEVIGGLKVINSGETKKATTKKDVTRAKAEDTVLSKKPVAPEPESEKPVLSHASGEHKVVKETYVEKLDKVFGKLREKLGEKYKDLKKNKKFYGKRLVQVAAVLALSVLSGDKIQNNKADANIPAVKIKRERVQAPKFTIKTPKTEADDTADRIYRELERGESVTNNNLNESPEKKDISTVAVTFEDGKDIIAGILEFRQKILDFYDGNYTPAPESVRDFMDTDPKKEAIRIGLLSVDGKVGATVKNKILGLNKYGNIVFGTPDPSGYIPDLLRYHEDAIDDHNAKVADASSEINSKENVVVESTPEIEVAPEPTPVETVRAKTKTEDQILSDLKVTLDGPTPTVVKTISPEPTQVEALTPELIKKQALERAQEDIVRLFGQNYKDQWENLKGMKAKIAMEQTASSSSRDMSELANYLRILESISGLKPGPSFSFLGIKVGSASVEKYMLNSLKKIASDKNLEALKEAVNAGPTA